MHLNSENIDGFWCKSSKNTSFDFDFKKYCCILQKKMFFTYSLFYDGVLYLISDITTGNIAVSISCDVLIKYIFGLFESYFSKRECGKCRVQRISETRYPVSLNRFCCELSVFKRSFSFSSSIWRIGNASLPVSQIDRPTFLAWYVLEKKLKKSCGHLPATISELDV